MITSKTAAAVRSIFEPFVELVKTWNLPEWLVHWGHPGNMVSLLHCLYGICHFFCFGSHNKHDYYLYCFLCLMKVNVEFPSFEGAN